MALYFAEILGVVTMMIGLSFILGERHRERTTDLPYEGGVASLGSAKQRLSVRFYQIALFFVIFDLESIFLFAWAVALHEAGWNGFFTAFVFVGILLLALGYLWRQGALDWNRRW